MKIKKFQYGGPGYFNKHKPLIPKNIDSGTKKIAGGFNWLMGNLGKAFNTVLTAGASTDFGQTSPFTFSSGEERKNISKAREQTRLKVNKAIEENSVYISPTSYAAAITLGSINPKVGAEVLSRDPRLQALGIIGDIATFKYSPKVVRAVPKTVDRGLAAAGNKGAKGRVIAREIDKNIPKGRLEVTDNYFNAPDKWYRIANRPEKIGIELEGRNVTTRDADYTPGTSNRWRADMQDTGEIDIFDFFNGGRHLEPGKGVNEGYFVFMPGSRAHKTGSAHGNTSLASKGSVWKGGVAGNNELFPMGIIEGQAPSVVPYGKSRSNFVNTPWEEVPEGGRIGFHTGEMPMSNLGWFLRLSNGRYTYEPIIPEKRIHFDPNKKLRILGSLPRLVDSKTYPMYRGPRFSVNSIVNPDGTVNPRLAMTVLHSVADWFGNKAHRMENRLENSKWHKDDPTTYDHTRNVALSAWRLPTPEGFTKQDQMVSALGHDFGKMIAGEGHALIGADLARQVFPDLTDAQYNAIAEHMGTPTTPLGLITKAADITNGRPFTYLQQYAPGLYSQYLGNTIYRVTQPNGKVRLLLPSHTEAKPREITLEPLGNNKFYTHMRIWDDVDKQVPGKINDVEKNNLFLALYETLPEEGEILFPQSGPGFYGTRGTVAGLQRLSRDSRFSPGTPGTLLYLDKDGKTVRTYNGTSFIKSRPNRDITFMYSLPEVTPRLQPYVLVARQAKEQNIQNLAQQARDYANSPLRRALDLQLNLEAHDLGFLGDNESLQFMLPNNKPPKIQIHDEQIPGENAGVNGNYIDATNTINLTGASAQGFTPFHEHLHYYGIGANPIITLTKLGRLFYNVQLDGTHGKPLIETDAVFNIEGTRKRSGYYREHKLDEVLNPEEMQKLNGDDYLYIRSEELPVHGLTTGKELGIEPFSPYPGDTAMPEVVNKAITKNPWLRVVKHSNSSELLNFWKLLTGSYLGLSTPLIFRYNEEK